MATPQAVYSYGRTASNGMITVDDDFLPALRGEQRKRVFTQMTRNDETIGALRTLITGMMLTVPWNFDAADGDTDKQYADIAENLIIKDMGDPENPYPGTSFDDFLQNIYTAFEWGHAVFDTVTYTRSDGQIGIQEMLFIGQNSIDEWRVDETGRATAVVQYVPITGDRRTIERERYVHVLYRPNCGSPEGESGLRNAYKPWLYKKRLQEVEAIQAERGTGLAVMYADPQILVDMNSADETIATHAKALDNSYKQTLKNIRANKEAGVLLYAAPYESQDVNTGQIMYSGMRTVEFKFETPSPTNAVDLDKVIRRYDIAIARVILADFMFLGTSGSGGNRSLSDNSTSLFMKGVQSFMENIASTLNRQLIPKLWKLNGLPDDMRPTLRVGALTKESLSTLGTYIRDLTGSGVLTPDESLEEFLRSEGGLPERDDELTRGGLPELSVDDNAP